MALFRPTLRNISPFAFVPFGLALLAAACGGESSAVSRAGLSQGCSINSDCTSPLVCAFGKCHAACRETRDCASFGNDVQCVSSSAKPLRVCQLPEETKCTHSSACPGTQVCASDGRCRDRCVADKDCGTGQLCVRLVCVEPGEAQGLLATTPAAGEGQSCEYNTQCADPLVCRMGRCIRECLGDRDCAVGEKCDPMISRCSRPAGSTSGGTDAGDASGEDAGGGDATVAEAGSDSGSDAPDETSDAGDATVADSGGDPDASSDAAPDAAADSGNDAGSTANDAGPGSDSGGGTVDGGASDGGGGTIPVSCANGQKDGTETDIDCGGTTCLPCTSGSACTVPRDCVSGVCTSVVCRTPTCSDGVKNGGESGIDCGGSTCNGCPNGNTCFSHQDCSSGRCFQGLCRAASCDDGIQDGTETDVDCGGSSCPKCDNTKRCSTANDCVSGACQNGLCQAPGCIDGVRNGTETDVDCGGASCAACGSGLVCGAASDCQSFICQSNRCVAPRCNDGRKNGTETDIDCGGTSCSACGDTKACLSAGDCTSGFCKAGRCSPTVSLTIQTAGGGLGRVTSVPGGLDCGSACTARFPVGSVVTISGAANPNFSFGGFMGAGCAGTGSCAIILNANTTVTATFNASVGGTAVWGKRWAGNDSGSAFARAIAIDSSNRVVLGLHSRVPVSFGSGTFSPRSYETFFTSFRADGTATWTQQITSFPLGSMSTHPRVVTTDTAGDVYGVVLGDSGGVTSQMDMGGGLVGCTGAASNPIKMGLVKYRGDNGAHLWSKCFASQSSDPEYTGSTSPRAARITSDGNLLIAGWAMCDVNLGLGAISNTCNGQSPFVMKVRSTDGATSWARLFSAASGAAGFTRLAVDPSGGFVALGILNQYGSVTIGSTTLANTHGADDLIVARFDGSGNPLWAKVIGGPGLETAGGVAIDANDNVIVVGSFSQTLNPGGGLPPLQSVGDLDVMVLTLRGSDGTTTRALRYGGAGHDSVGLEEDGDGFTSTGQPAYSNPFSTNNFHLMPNGDLLIAGRYAGATEFGGVALPSANHQVFMARLDPAGNPVWVRQYGGQPGNDFLLDVAVGPTGLLVVGGWYRYEPTSDWDQIILDGGGFGYKSAFFVRIAP